MVAVKCKACNHVTVKKRTPARCENCGAKFAIVGGELTYLNQQHNQPAPSSTPAPKHQIKAKVEAKKLEITPEPEKKAPPAKEEPLECANCGAVLMQGQENCPKCGVALEWGE